METGTSFARLEPRGEDRFQRLRAELGVTTFGLNLLRLGPGARSRIHRHERQEEVYLVLEGTLTLVVEQHDSREMGRGDLARVAPGVRRQLVNRHPEPLVLLAVGGANAHEGRDGRAYASWDEDGDGRPPDEVPLPPNAPVEESS
jgi:uncharacterized cupin superfamily protein